MILQKNSAISSLLTLSWLYSPNYLGSLDSVLLLYEISIKSGERDPKQRNWDFSFWMSLLDGRSPHFFRFENLFVALEVFALDFSWYYFTKSFHFSDTFFLGDVYWRRCEILSCRVSYGFGPFTWFRNYIQGFKTREVSLVLSHTICTSLFKWLVVFYVSEYKW